MKPGAFLIIIVVIAIPACGSSQTIANTMHLSTKIPTIFIFNTAMPVMTQLFNSSEAILSFTPLTEPCSTPSRSEMGDFINRSITFADSGETFVSHMTTRFCIFLDDRIYLLRDLLNSIPIGLIGYISNGSIRGLQCYPIMFEAIQEGTGVIRLKDFQLSITINNNLPESMLPLN
jgi:hypothetical protein